MVVRSDPKFGARLGSSSRTEMNGEQLMQSFSRSSLSGHERNHLFLSQRGERFTDLSALSGLDHPGDSRAFALLDFDRDGWLDVAVVNANAPLLQLFRNRIGDRPIAARPVAARPVAAGPEASSRVLALRFAGGNRTARPDPEKSNRDGFGASVTVDLGDLRIVREHRAGEGFASQNRPTMLIGLGGHREVRSLTVRWPSGRVHEATAVAAGRLVTAYEDPAVAPTGEAFTFTDYAVPRPMSGGPAEQPADRLRLAEQLTAAPSARLRMFTTVATWCEACKREMPQLRLLRSALGPQDLEMFGVPVDESESRERLEAFAAEHQPPYRLLLELGPQAVAEIKARVLEALHQEAIPATLVSDREGRLLYLEGGVPTVSDLRRLLDQP